MAPSATSAGRILRKRGRFFRPKTSAWIAKPHSSSCWRDSHGWSLSLSSQRETSSPAILGGISHHRAHLFFCEINRNVGDCPPSPFRIRGDAVHTHVQHQEAAAVTARVVAALRPISRCFKGLIAPRLLSVVRIPTFSGQGYHRVFGRCDRNPWPVAPATRTPIADANLRRLLH